MIQTEPVKNGSMGCDQRAGQVKEFTLNYGVTRGRLAKHIRPGQSNEPPRPDSESGVDASLIGISIPYNMLAPEDPIMQATVQAIETDLHCPAGGVYRYKADVFYGGGEWLLLTAWLGWYYATVGKIERAKTLCRWIESQADVNGALAEQVSDHLLASEHYLPWLDKWGPVAKPLTWSHAMYIILVNAIRDNQSR
jgi:GH15 family glucan-1,4-alpha-glucosidase